MNQDVRLQALSVFLKTQRAKIAPAAVGLPEGTRRRTPGLRREEVAQLAGVSTTWYTWLEQGRDIQVSHSVLDNIASALKLTPDERKYLFSLAMEHYSELHIPEEEPYQLHPSLQKILQELQNCPPSFPIAAATLLAGMRQPGMSSSILSRFLRNSEI